MKKLIFNAVILNEVQTGLGVYTKNVLFRLLKQNCIHTIICDDNTYTQREIIGKVNCNVVPISVSSGKLSFLKRNFIINRYIKKNFDSEDYIIYSPTQHGIRLRKADQVITIHDLMPIFYPEGRFHQYLYYKWQIPKVIDKCKKVITVSYNTKKDIIKYFKINPDKVEVIYNGYDESEYKEIDVNKKYDLKDYFLMIGIHYNYKNLHSVIMAFSKYFKNSNAELVIAGNYKVPYGYELMNISKELGIEDKVKFLGYVSDEEKTSLFRNSIAFIYPSLYEGFGLPILEAMNNKTLIMASNSSALPEIGGDAIIYFDPENIDEIGKNMENVYLNRNDFEKLIERYTERLKLFSWDDTACQLGTVLNRLM